MKRRKREVEEFDVSAFLRESDSDLRSALTTMLQPGSNLEPDSKLIPGLNLTPDINMTPAITPTPEVTMLPEVTVEPGPTIASPPIMSSASGLGAAPALAPPLEFDLAAGFPAPPAASLPDPEIPTPSAAPPAPAEVPNATPGATVAAAAHIHPVRALHDGHTRAERHVYETLWTMAEPYDERSRLVTVGFATLGRYADLSESNARINLRSLIRKLALEEFESYDCAQSRGRTYRIFNEAAILERRREAGLVWFRKRTMGVIFVDPATGDPV